MFSFDELQELRRKTEMQELREKLMIFEARQINPAPESELSEAKQARQDVQTTKKMLLGFKGERIRQLKRLQNTYDPTVALLDIWDGLVTMHSQAGISHNDLQAKNIGVQDFEVPVSVIQRYGYATMAITRALWKRHSVKPYSEAEWKRPQKMPADGRGVK
eukprot:Filipodium_phascolosomae@DN7420_c0_g1_i1.p1